jgi:hypothetical protein
VHHVDLRVLNKVAALYDFLLEGVEYLSYKGLKFVANHLTDLVYVFLRHLLG